MSGHILDYGEHQFRAFLPQVCSWGGPNAVIELGRPGDHVFILRLSILPAICS